MASEKGWPTIDEAHPPLAELVDRREELRARLRERGAELEALQEERAEAAVADDADRLVEDASAPIADPDMAALENKIQSAEREVETLRRAVEKLDDRIQAVRSRDAAIALKRALLPHHQEHVEQIREGLELLSEGLSRERRLQGWWRSEAVRGPAGNRYRTSIAGPRFAILPPDTVSRLNAYGRQLAKREDMESNPWEYRP